MNNFHITTVYIGGQLYSAGAECRLQLLRLLKIVKMHIFTIGVCCSNTELLLYISVLGAASISDTLDVRMRALHNTHK